MIYTDIGMNEETYALAMARLSPIQCCLSGYPVTTGLSTIDYYISSRNFESASAKEHYSETLILLDNLPALIARTELPEFDKIMANILCAALNGIIILFDDAKLKHFAKILGRRFAKTIPDLCQRIIFIPWLNRDQFKQMLLKAHVILDPIHFGRGTTA